MRAAVLLALTVVWQAAARVAPEPQRFRYERVISVPVGTRGRVCAALDGAMYEHSTALTDVRVYGGASEVPYALMASHAEFASEPAEVMNVGERGGAVAFDLKMPGRAYSTVELELSGKDFIGSAKVWGFQGLGDKACCSSRTMLGTFTVFDLTSQRLGRNTRIGLGESTFPYLHVELEVRAAPGRSKFEATPGMVLGATVPPSREAQTLYTTIAATSEIVQRGQESVATFHVPAHVPVERVSFDLEPGDKTNFSRAVRVTARSKPVKDEVALPEELTGEIARVHLTAAGQDVREQSLSVPAIVGSNSRDAAVVTVAVENGDDRPVALKAVRLEMRQRLLCFDDPQAPVLLYYGDPRLTAPVYDYAKLFRAADRFEAGQLGQEEPNPAYVAPEEHRTLTERHPGLVWVALVGAICALGFVAFRSAKRV